MMTLKHRRLRVFLCHSSNDKPAVRELYYRLNKEPWIDPWLDEDKILPGQDWDLEIEKAVKETDAVIVCLSKNSITKEGYVQRELRMILKMAEYKPEGTLFIVPIRFEDCPLPRRLEMWHYVDFFPLSHYELNWGRVLASLQMRAKALGIRATTETIGFSAEIHKGEAIQKIPPKSTTKFASTSVKDIKSKPVVRPPLKIMVAGGRKISRRAEKAAFAIGCQIISRGHILISHGASGADFASAQGALSICERKSFPSTLIEVYRPSGDREASFSFGNLHLIDKSFSEYRKHLVDISDAVIVIDGGDETRKVINYAIKVGKPLLPLGYGNPTAAACVLWQKLMAGLIESESQMKIDDLRKLGPKEDVETIAINALILAENLIYN